MIVVKHRINTIAELQTTPASFGVEIDVRSGERGLYLAHDAFMLGDLLDDWLKFYTHRLLIVNVKEDGLEDEILHLLKRHSVSSFFFLDQALPTIIRRGIAGNRDSALRISEYESIESAQKLAGFCGWAWVDFFHQPELSQEKVRQLRALGLKVCLVSPELHASERVNQIAILQGQLSEAHLFVEAVCTKFPERWQQD